MKKENGIKADDPCEMEKEVTLLDFLIVILKHKRLIIICVLIATAIAVSHITYTNFKNSKIRAHLPPPPLPPVPTILGIFVR